MLNQCTATTKAGKRCKRNSEPVYSIFGVSLCRQHYRMSTCSIVLRLKQIRRRGLRVTET